MLATLIGSRLPQRYRKYFKLPEQLESWKIEDTGETALGRAVQAWLQGREKNCAVYRLDLGIDALSARLGLIEAAERSIDIQSYLLSDDLSGNLVAMKLVEAAERGVRVRLLMDDALTEAIDAGLLNLDDHDNVEVRVFNPFPRRRSRLISFIAYFNILNRRMHNKTFTVDNQVTIVGGRNLADEYFQTGSEQEFIDEDILAVGAVVNAVSEGFDEYWNTAEAIPISVFDPVIRRLPAEGRIADSAAFLERHKESTRLSQIHNEHIQQLLAGTLLMTPADVELVLDRPDKVRRLVGREPSRTSVFLRNWVASAKEEVIIVSPYFVPQKQGVEFLSQLVRKGVRVVIVTNSLASTNHSSVHAAYARYRKPLLRNGVQLYELRPRLSRRAGSRFKLTLHSKVAVIDRYKTFVGSFNLDPRSLYINTEMGIAVQSPGVAQVMAGSILETLQTSTYRLELSATERLQWKYLSDGRRETVLKEPHTSVWRRLGTALMSLLPIEAQM